MTETTPTTPTPPEGLTDVELAKLAAAVIPTSRFPYKLIETQAFCSELIAYARAAIAAHEAARPTPTPEEIEASFRAWWAESYPNAPAGGHAVASHVGFARHLFSRGVQ